MAGEPDPTEHFGPLRAELIGLAYRMTGSLATAEDIAQEVFLRWHAADVDQRNAALHADSNGIMGPMPGTVVLVFVFLAAFVVYFFVNWKILSFVWKIG